MEVYTIVGTAIWGIILSVLLYLFSTRRHDYFKKLNITYVPPIPFFGSTLGNFSKPLQDVELERYKKYGRLYGIFEGNTPTLSIADPELLRDILVKDFHVFPNRRNFSTGDELTEKMVSTIEGEDWKRIRSIITPTFTSGKIKKMVKIFKECAEMLERNFDKAVTSGKAIDVKEFYGAFTMDVIASSAFSTKIDSRNDPKNKFVQTAKAAFHPWFPWRFMLFFLAPSIMRFFKINVFGPEGTAFFKDVTIQIIEERKKTKQKRNDFLQLLLDTVEEIEGSENKSENPESEENKKEDEVEQEYEQVFQYTSRKKPMSMTELIAQCIIFFLAGYETTGATMSFISYVLAVHPEVQEKLIAQIDDALKKNKGELTYDAIQEMKYLDNILSETLRLYPPAVRTDRVAEEDYKLGNTGITIPKGMIVGIPLYAMHRDPEFFPDPEKFDPDRFKDMSSPYNSSYSYMPFGFGPRNCIGMRFALTEIKVCITYILSKFRFKRAPETKVPLEFGIGSGILTAKRIMLKLEKRKDAVDVKSL